MAKTYWLFLFHLKLDLPEIFIEGREEQWLRHLYSEWCYNPHSISDDAFNTYVRAYRSPGAVRGALARRSSMKRNLISVALFPATSDSEKISFNQINRKTGHRIKYAKVDADTGEEVSNDDIMKGYKVDTDTYIEVSKDELENIVLEML
jgi:hypothetical protein